jgi:hypothetical protein
MLGIVAVLLFTRPWKSNIDRATFAFVASAAIAGLIALTPSKSDVEAQNPDRSIVERSPPVQVDEGRPGHSRILARRRRRCEAVAAMPSPRCRSKSGPNPGLSEPTAYDRA